ncbi:apolipoprotein N-acyltransferase [Treponema sp.]|uniref:apolipoprotein N-acyltransferase n=1 Tax=Treponema sp. TaxID=166 RepID=UPI003F0851D0
MNQLFLQVFYAIFSGAAEAISISNDFLLLGSPASALICLSPLYIAVYNSKSYRQTFCLFFIQTLTVHILSSYWLSNFRGFAWFTLGASALGTALIGGICGIIANAFPSRISKSFYLREKAGNCPGAVLKRMFWFCACWIFYEYVKSTGSLGYPWGTIFMAGYSWKVFTQISDITGVWGVTFLYTLSSCLAAEAIMARGSSSSEGFRNNLKDAFKFTAAVFTVCALYGAIQISVPRQVEKIFNAVVVQQNIDPWEGGDLKSISISKKLSTEGIRQLTKQGKETDLVIWSEGVLSKHFPQAESYYSNFPADESLKDFISKTKTPFLIGGEVLIDRQNRRKTNSALLFDKNGIFSGFYSKMHLVPFAEGIPYGETFFMKQLTKRYLHFSSSLVPGFQYVLFKIPLKENTGLQTPLDFNREKTAQIHLDKNGNAVPENRELFIKNNQENPLSFLKFSAPICFEDSFPSVCTGLFNMGSEIFINLTNDSWSKTVSAEMQHFIVASYLALEYRTTLLRCANSGYSVVLNPAGKILYDLPLFKEASMGISVPVYKTSATVYSTLGDWFAYLMAASVLLYIVFASENLHDVFKRLFYIFKPKKMQIKTGKGIRKFLKKES